MENKEIEELAKELKKSHNIWKEICENGFPVRGEYGHMANHLLRLGYRKSKLSEACEQNNPVCTYSHEPPINYCNKCGWLRTMVESQQEKELKPMKEINLTQEFSGKVWAEEFSKMYPMILKDGEGAMLSEEVMLGWFCNAIMAGYDHARKEQRTSKCGLDEVELYKVLSDYAVLPTHAVNIPEQRRELAKLICSTFTPYLPSVDDIEKLICKLQEENLQKKFGARKSSLEMDKVLATAILARLKEKR